MTYRQKFLKAIYPGLVWFNHLTGSKNNIMVNTRQSNPSTSIYDLTVLLNDGSELRLESLKGKKSFW